MLLRSVCTPPVQSESRRNMNPFKSGFLGRRHLHEFSPRLELECAQQRGYGVRGLHPEGRGLRITGSDPCSLEPFGDSQCASVLILVHTTVRIELSCLPVSSFV